ncbi:PREDICTED: uncharacterized protein LOC106119254 [Papilio xuthus]|uniref:Uncharacterized protein LOC106119254 n=1 Tax=Papilio xuthus TaxID=66420 RepID=A0AAJ7EAR4_PAPXU|nr:PREDICTED: uncharacterized protein LOC106119254 [Papilio xuthus]
MQDLLQSQIKDSCKLALPEGLRDLMCDISREVLRARPQDLYQFIADYLAAMLVARETLTIAGHVCKGICNCGCEPELDDELGKIGLTQEEIVEAKTIIIQYLEKDKVKEEKLMAKLLRTNIDKQKLPDIQKAVKAAYKRNLQLTNSDGSDDDVTKAAKYTLESYLKSGSPDRKHAETNEEQPAFYDAGQNKYHQITEASSSNSSQCMFKNIAYDGGIKDLYISSNCKPSKDELKNEIDEEIVKDDKFEEFGDECENIDDEVLYADDESDISITEDISETDIQEQ